LAYSNWLGRQPTLASSEPLAMTNVGQDYSR
jgi:hypothetical protein